MTSPAPRRGEAATGEDEVVEKVALALYDDEESGNWDIEDPGIREHFRDQARRVLALPEVAELRRSERAAEALSIADRIDRSLMTRAEIVPWLRTWARVLAEEPPPALASSSATEPESAS